MGISINLRGKGDMNKAVYDPNKDGIIALAETEAKNLLSVLVIDTDLALGAHNLTQNAGGTIAGKDIATLYEGSLASLGEASKVGSSEQTVLSFTAKKTMYLNLFCYLKAHATDTAYLKLYDGANLRTTLSHNTTSYVEKFAENLLITKGNVIYVKLYGVAGGATSWVKKILLVENKEV